MTKKIAKYIQSLSHKKSRDEEGAFIAEGPKVVAEFLLAEKFDPVIICGNREWLSANGSLLKKIPADDIFEIDEHWLSRISQLKTPNKILGVFRQGNKSTLPDISNKLTLMLDDIQDPGNMGTLIRIGDWFGIENIICSENSADQYNSKVVQSTMGSLNRVNVYYEDLPKFIEKNRSVPVYAAALEGVSVFEKGKVTEGIILIGNESKGIHESLMAMASDKITIPRFGHAESLNAAVAAGIILSYLK